jgi:excisionase family DNA binding protein
MATCPERRVMIPNFKRKDNAMAGNFEVLTAKEVSDVLHIHPHTVYKLAKTGKIPSFRIGTEWRFRSDLIQRWMIELSMDVLQSEEVPIRASASAEL